ncbi:MAG: hypothetical protein M3Z01_02095 [Thermoproteota archaeon]|nr:hypothetical protein [Thermoproteota archaeon]
MNETITKLLQCSSIELLLILLMSTVIPMSLPFLSADSNNNTLRAEQHQTQQQQQTSQGAPLALIPCLTGNILTTVSFFIGTSSFILGLKIQIAAWITSSSTQSTSPLSIISKYFDLLILALVIPSIVINIYGILMVGSHLYPEDAPYLLLLFALFIPVGAILFLVKKLH